MTTRTSRWTTDLLVVLVTTVLATGAILVAPEGSLLRTALVVPFVVFLPGYAFVSAFFPEQSERSPSADRRPVAAPGTVGDGVSPTARVGLAVAISVALVPGTVLVFAVSDGRIRPVISFLALAGLTVVLTLVALLRRRRLPATDRFAVPAVTHLFDAFGRAFTTRERNLSRPALSNPTSKRGLVLNLVLALSVLVFVGSVAGAYAYDTQGEEFTELYLVTQSDGGEFVASDYPRSVGAGQTRPVYAAVTNREGERTSYTLVVELQRVEENGTHVVEEREVARTSRTVDAGETVRIRHDLQPSFGDGRMRVRYLLYVGDAPDDASAETAYRSAHFWVSVNGAQAGGA